jgi:hypothetical protein
MAKRLLPSLNRVLVEKLVQPKKTAGGILLPETSKQVLARLALASSCPHLHCLLGVAGVAYSRLTSRGAGCQD